MSENYGKLFCGILLAALSLTAQSQGWQVPQPSAGLMPNPASGKKLFLQHCAACHGADLMGVESGEKKGPPLLHKIYEPSHHGDAAFQLAVKNGVRAHHWPRACQNVARIWRCRGKVSPLRWRIAKSVC